jgi:haloacid dehalogenase-like hydrolase
MTRHSDGPTAPTGMVPAQLQDVVVLFDVDNTLLDNDRVQADLHDHLGTNFGAKARDRYWELFEQLRGELGYSDYLGALERYRVEELHDPRVLRIGNWLADYPFAERLFPAALDAVRHARQWGPTVILSDGDAVFQPRKVERSGLWRAFDDRVLIYIHKEAELDDVEHWFPARHYVLVDDKIRILHAVKQVWGDRVTTVFPRQGRYAIDPREVTAHPPADLTIERIGDLLHHDLAALRRPTSR